MTQELETDTIPDNWEYVRPFKYLFLRRIPVAWIYTGHGQFQCRCPYCDAGSGYNKSLVWGRAKTKILTCDRCKTEFMGFVPK